MNGVYTSPGGAPLPRLASRAFNLEDPSDLEAFLHGDPREITVPGGTRTITFDRLARIGVGVSRRGTSEATAAGAYAFALSHLPERTQRC